MENTGDSQLSNVKKQLESGQAILIDCRESEEWDDEHFEGAVHLALSALKQGNCPKQLNSETRHIYIHCKTGQGSQEAASLLAQQSITTTPLSCNINEMLIAGFLLEDD